MSEGYDYNKFLSDSSDDYPKYGDNLNVPRAKDWRAERKYLQEKWGKSGSIINIVIYQKQSGIKNHDIYME